MKLPFYTRLATGLILFLSLSACVSSGRSPEVALEPLAPFSYQQRQVIAVLPFEYTGEQEDYGKFSRKLDDLAIVEIFNSKRFRVVERSRIDAVLQEVRLGQAGITNDEIAYQVGQQLGAEMVLVGSLSSIKAIHDRDSLGIAVSEAKGIEISLQGRLIDVVKGEILAVGNSTGVEIQKSKVAMGASTGVIAPEATLINLALEKAVKNLV
ncbi:MAG: CsgG/HfaB family protein, partial [Desulfuromonadaceae bacterium]